MKSSCIIATLLCFSLFPAQAEKAPQISAGTTGIAINAGEAGKFTLKVPKLRLSSEDFQGEQAVVEADGGNGLKARYPSGAELTMKVKDNVVSCNFTGIPEGAYGLQFLTEIPIRFNMGGKFAFGKNPLQPFPETKEKQLAGQGTATEFRLVDGTGAGFKIGTPMDYQQMQDNRVFGWPVFMYILNYTFKSHEGANSFSLAFHPLEAPAATSAAPGAQAPPAAAATAPSLALTSKGTTIRMGPAGSVTLPIPNLSLGATDYSGEKPIVEKEGTDGIVARYSSGGELRMKLSSANTITCSFQGIPETARGFVFQTQIPINFNGGGSFILGKKAATDFPEQKGKQIIQDGYADSFSVTAPSGEGFTLKMPGEYQQVQDNRAFDWPVFMHIYTFNFKTHAGQTKFAFQVEGAKPSISATADTSEPRKFLVDRYGQSARKEYPGKVKSDEELRVDAAKQVEEQASFIPNPKLDRFGGLAGSGEKYNLKKTGFFHLGKAGERDVLVTPDGNAFFQLAVCGITNTDDYTTVAGREKVYEWTPPQDSLFGGAWRPNTPGAASFYIANWIRKFNKPYDKETWVAQAVSRLRSWGFNSSGAFSGYPKAFKELDFANVGFLPLGEGDGVKVLPDKVGAQQLLDPFVPGTEKALEVKFAKALSARANDPLLLGYFLGNEQHFELLPKLIPSYKASKVAAKARLAEMLEKKYGSDIAKLNAAWEPAKPFADFEGVREEPLFIRTKAGAADMKEFYELYLESYFSMVERAFRKTDPNHLLIGSRLTPGTANNEVAVRISSKYTDVNSINYYTYAIEDGFLKQFHQWSGDKPIIFSEWYYSATEHGLNGGKEVRNQAERAEAYRNYVEQSAALPFVVGQQWFIYMDQSITGRFFEGFNGEGANTGLVDVTDRPYTELVAAAKETNSRIYEVMFGKVTTFVCQDPRFNPKQLGVTKRVVTIAKALPGLKMDGSTTNWPGRPAEPIEASRLVVGNPNPKLRGDFRLCWDQTNLYFLIQVKDPTPLNNKQKAENLWRGDGVELFIGANDLEQTGSPLFSDRQIFIGASETAKLHIVDHPEDAIKTKSLVVKDVTDDGYVLQTVIPWESLGITPKPGLELLFDVMIDNSDDGDMRKEQLSWNGTASNSKERGGWGRARLLEN